jgi:hypothetical protein
MQTSDDYLSSSDEEIDDVDHSELMLRIPGVITSSKASANGGVSHLSLPTTKKSKKQVQWTEQMKYKLAKEVNRAVAYMTTKDSMETKFKIVLNKLEGDDAFEGINISVKALMNQYRRLSADVLKELGISEEGANLSGLDESPSDYQQLMIDMERKRQKSSKEKLNLKLKKKSQTKLLGSIEHQGLQSQGSIGASLGLPTASSSSSSSQSTHHQTPDASDSVISMSISDDGSSTSNLNFNYIYKI